MGSWKVRVGASVALIAWLGLASAPASAQSLSRPILDVANPSEGDMLTPGALVMQGVAFDEAATSGTGVDRVTAFLDDRDAGGVFLAEATLGQPSIGFSPEVPAFRLDAPDAGAQA